VCQLFFQETLPKEKRSPFQTKKLLADFTKALTSAAFWKIILVVSLIFAGYLVFLSITSVLFVLEFGIDKLHFPYYQAAILATWLVASMVYTWSLESFGAKKIKVIGTSCIAFGGIFVVLSSIISPQNAILITAGMLFYTFGANWVQGLYFPEGMELFPDIKGITASLLTSLRLLLTSLVVWITSSLYNATIYPVAGAIGLIVALIIPLIISYERKASPKALRKNDTFISH
jgi:DHA1 family bicyclomycin/chloramphenicol resistance-like MFS transporter